MLTLDTNSNTTLVKVKFTSRKIVISSWRIQIQHLLKLNNLKVGIHVSLLLNSNTTLVKVKFIKPLISYKPRYNSNTTLVKVKS